MNKANTLGDQLKRLYICLDKKIIIKALASVHRWAGNQVNKRADKYAMAPGSAGWKEQALVDFKAWLSQVEALPENAPLTDETSCDLYSLLAEFLSLKKQIEIQNREQSRQIRGLTGFNEFSDQGRDILDRLGEKIDHLEMMTDKACESGRLEAVRCFLDVRDPLVRGADAVRFSGNGLFGMGREKKKAMVQGYEMALRKLDQALGMTETIPIETRGQTFDPALMTAVDTRQAAGGESGLVINEVSSGFIRKGKVIRPAQVIVSK